MGQISMTNHKITSLFHRTSLSLPRLLPTCFVDISLPSLHLYGAGALEALENLSQEDQAVTEISFHCVEFTDLVPWLPKIARYCPQFSVSFV